MRKHLITLFLLLFLFMLLIGGYWVYESRMFVMRSRATENEVSSVSSYVFAMPYCANANNQDTQIYTIFCMTADGLGKQNQTVTLRNNPNITLRARQSRSDKNGKAIYEATSSVPLQTDLDVSCGGVTLEATVPVCFK